MKSVLHVDLCHYVELVEKNGLEIVEMLFLVALVGPVKVNF